MNLIIHNLRVAVRNLMKYKLQTLISVVSIAIGIVTLSLTNSILTSLSPMRFDKVYFERMYSLRLKRIDTGEHFVFEYRILRVLKANGGLKSAEKIVGRNQDYRFLQSEFHLADSSIRKGEIYAALMDPEYVELLDIRSAVTGKRLRVPKPGEAIVSETFARKKFGDMNPIGAVQVATAEMQPVPVRIVDVFESTSESNTLLLSHALQYVIDEEMEGFDDLASRYIYVFPVYLVLKEGYSRDDLMQELMERLEPFGFMPELDKVSDQYDYRLTYLIHMLVYFIGALTLLAAVIGYFRLQLQLFRLRGRELSLRLVNGAGVKDLFSLLMTEVAVSILLSIASAVVLGELLERFLNKRLELWITQANFNITSLWIFSVATGVVLLGLSCFVSWIEVRRIMRSKNGLTAFMRRSRSHLFRNAMLGIQILICLIFVCSTLILAKGGEAILKGCHVPENNKPLDNSLYFKKDSSGDMSRLIEEIRRAPGLDRMLLLEKTYTCFKEIKENPEAAEKLDNHIYFGTHYSDDPSLLSVLGVEVEWINRKADRRECIVMQRELFNRLQKAGLLDNLVLTIQDVTYPIAGIAGDIPYHEKQDGMFLFSSISAEEIEGYLLVPKPGSEKEFGIDVEQTVQRLEPEMIDRLVSYYRDKESFLPGLVETVKTGGVILGIVSLIMCGLGIFSAIALDTRGRRKEIAIRKINGAKRGDIYRMFGKVYVVLVLVAIMIAVPVCALFNKLILSIIQQYGFLDSLSPVWPIILGILIVVCLTGFIVGLQIRKVMRTDPAKIIAKE